MVRRNAGRNIMINTLSSVAGQFSIGLVSFVASALCIVYAAGPLPLVG
jgi:hypothetical protein